jgi:predicted alternative tryptophan synthase beta-subunit
MKYSQILQQNMGLTSQDIKQYWYNIIIDTNKKVYTLPDPSHESLPKLIKIF